MRYFNGVFYTGVARFLTIFILIALIISPVSAQNANNASLDCVAEQGVSFLCGFDSPEDILNVGSSGLVLASGGRGPGLMYLIDPISGTWSELINSDSFRMQHDTNAWPDCPGLMNLEAFDVHGLSLRETSPGLFSIYTTSHGEREAVEIYELDLRTYIEGAAPVLTWTGCVLLQQDGRFNSVEQFADGGFVTTRMVDNNVNPGLVWGTITGQLFEWHPGGQLLAIPGTELSIPNGIAVSADERYLYVTASGTEELVRFDRRASPIAKDIVSTPINPDNVHWASNGKLIIGGSDLIDSSACPGPVCFQGWEAIEVDPDTLAISSLGSGDENSAMPRATAAIRVGNEVWVSGPGRIARFQSD